MTAFDLVLRGGLLVDGTGTPGRAADVGVLGDRILAVGDLGAIDDGAVGTVIDVTGLVVTPGFIDPHGHSDGSLFLDGALISHLAQGFTTQLSGNCGDSLAPITDRGRELVELSLRPNDLVARWRTFGEYLDAVEAVGLGPNVAFLVGQGTIRGSVLGPDAVAPDDLQLRSMVREVEAAMEAGAFGLSSGLIYAPGMHAASEEVATLVTAATRRGGLYATHMRNEGAGLFESIDEAMAAVRAAADAGVPDARLQISHLKCGAEAYGAAPTRRSPCWRRPARTGWTSPPTSIPIRPRPRRWPRSCRRRCSRWAWTAASRRSATAMPAPGQGRDGARDLGLGERRRRSRLGRPPDLVRAEPSGLVRPLARRAGRELGHRPGGTRVRGLLDDRLDVEHRDRLHGRGRRATILAVPWIAVCTDAEGRRPGHPMLDAGRPHPRAYGSTARVLGRYVRDRGTIPLETAIAKLTAVPAARLGLRDRGVVREGAIADLVVVDPATVADVATYEEPAQAPDGIPHVIVGGRVAIRDGAETGARAGRLLRFAG